MIAPNGSTNPVDAVLRALERRGCDPQRTGSSWEARCPAHDDTRPSLSLNAGDDGRALVHCHKGCGFDAIVGGLGLEARDLMPASNGHHKANGFGTIVQTYDYIDEASRLEFQVVRLDPKDFRQRRPKDGGGWDWKVKGSRVLPFMLPKLLSAKPDQIVFIPEGEKDVIALSKIGLIATCNAGGAGKWTEAHSKFLKGRKVVVLPDNDQAGRDHARQVAKSLQGVALKVRVVELPGLPEKGDVSDWLAAGGDRQQLFDLVKATRDWEPTETPTRKTPARKPRPRHPVTSGDNGIELTDTWNAGLFIKQHGQDVRYCYALKRWLVWDGRRWVIDEGGAIELRAKQTIASIIEQDTAAQPDKLAEWAMASQAARKLPDMLALVKPDVVILSDALDRHPDLLNTPGQTIDLRSGDAYPNRREDFLTKITPVECPPASEAECPLWEEFLDRIFAGNTELIGFVKRAAGYSLTGHTTEHALFFAYGTGANGKSVFLNTLQAAFGSYYSMKAPPNLLMTKSHDSHPTERADLFGRRMVCCIEANDGQRLDEGLVKEMTGGDRIRARAMRQDFFEFTATHKIWLAANHKPQIRGTDHGIWRRIKLIPFTVTIPDHEQDKDLPDRLVAELPGILRWAVEGAIEWRRVGLNEPEQVRMATAEYREQEDVLGAFLAACCVIEHNACVPSTVLFNAYRDFTGDQRMNQTRLAKLLRDRGFHNDKFATGPLKNRMGWWGVGLLEGDADGSKG